MRTQTYLFVNGRDGTWQSCGLPARGSVTIGRSTEADMRLAEASVSPLHARLDVDDDGIWISDLRSANGTLVGTQVLRGETIAVRPGEPILIGHSLLVIQTSHAEDVPARVRSRAMASVEDLVVAIAPKRVNVLLVGEAGVEHDALAERIHRLSPRTAGPFARFGCAGVTHADIEHELPALFARAAGGTLFLDDIDALAHETQVLLARILDAIAPDVRFICAAHRDPVLEGAHDRLHAAFYDRMNGITIRIPPLRRRLEELDDWIAEFAREAAGPHPTPSFDGDALARLRTYAWPGNLRELRAVIERAVTAAAGGAITGEAVRAAGVPDARPAVDDERAVRRTATWPLQP